MILMKVLYTLVVTAIYTVALAQQPELVSDFNPGAEDSYAFLDAAYLGDDIIMTIRTEAVGDEIAVLSDGVVSVLKDINPGPEDGDPRSHINFNNQVYFSAFDESNGYAIWRTDGTPEGTVMDFDPSETNANIRAMIVADDGNLYYNHDGKVYRCDGVDHVEVFDGASLGFVFQQGAFNYCKYEEGIAFIVKNDDDSFSVYHIQDDESTELARTEEYGFFTDGYGIMPVTGGLAFNVEDSGANDLFFYDAATATLTSVLVGGSTSAAIRIFDMENGTGIGYFNGKGYQSFSGTETEKIFEASSIGVNQGQSIVVAIRNEHAAFVADEGVFGDAYLVYTDGTAAGTENLIEVQPYQSRMIQYGRYGFFADGTSNFFDPVIYQVDMEEGTVSEVYSYDQSSNNTNSIRPIGVQGGFLYYFSNLDQTVGTELYRIELDIVSAVDITSDSQLSYEVVQSGAGLQILSDDRSSVDVAIFSTSGTQILTSRVVTNSTFEFDVPTGLYYVQIRDSSGHSTKQVLFVR